MKNNILQKNIINGWHQVKLGDIGRVSMCKRIFKHETLPSGPVPFYKISTFGKVADSFISEEIFEKYKNKYPYPNKGDVLISASGTIGRTVVFDGKKAYFQDSNIIWIANSQDKALNSFLKYYYLTIKWKSTDGGVISRLYNEDVRSIKLYLPPVSEQQRIVVVLEIWDQTIEKMAKKINTKKNSKKALMQQLLTGKVRLPGHNQQWINVKLGEVCKRTTRRNTENNQNILTISAQNGLVSQSKLFKKRIAADNLENYRLLFKGDFAYNKSYSKGYPMGAIKMLENYDRGIVSSLYITFVSDGINPYYLKYYFDLGLYNKEISMVAQEGARNHGLLNIGIEDFFAGDLHIPKSEKERAEIANVLITADNEIILLEKKLSIVRKQKKFLLNNLITGAIRTPEK